MIEVFLKYNPYRVETTIHIDGELIGENSRLARYRNERLQVWIDQLIDSLIEELNENSFLLVFQGTQFDYEDILEVCERANASQSVTIELRYIPGEGSDDKIGELKNLFEHMQDGPFDELKSASVKRNFEKALSSDFEIAVIATMSSGKSTLINSMLGQELMPSKQAACTATIASIKNVDNQEDFIGRCLDCNDQEIESWQKIDLEKMQSFNENVDVSNIEIEGNIPNISSKRMSLVLVDTPGPNNSRNSSHREHTYKVIKNDTKPMVLYILNATQLAINDDNNLLTSVAKEMKSGGKQSKDRFIFAVNKIDELDPEVDGDIEDTLAIVKEYLEEKGIENPNVFPVSAEMAKIIRMYKNGQELTQKQRRTLRDHDFFIEEKDFHLVKYAPLSKHRKEKLMQQVDEAAGKGDTYQEALIHAGVPAIEEAINEYLEKYAVTSKITAAVNSFKDIVTGKELEQNLKNDLVSNDEKRVKVNEQMRKLKSEIEKGQRAQLFKNQINNKTYDQTESFREVEQKIEKKLLDLTKLFDDQERIEKEEAERIIDKLQVEISDIQSDIKTDLEKIIDNSIKTDIEELLEAYRNYVKDLIETSGDGLDKEQFQLLVTELPNTDFVISQLAYEEKIVHKETGERSRYNPKKGKSYERSWYNPKRMFGSLEGFWNGEENKYRYRDEVFETKHYVNVDDITESFIVPTRWSLLENVEAAEDYLISEEKKLKDYFNNEIDKLEALLYIKVDEIEKLSANNEYLESKLKEDQGRYEWLQDFIIKLDSILEV